MIAIPYSDFKKNFFDKNIMEMSQFDFICNNNNGFKSLALFAIFVVLLIACALLIHLLVKQRKELQNLSTLVEN